MQEWWEVAKDAWEYLLLSPAQPPSLQSPQLTPGTVNPSAPPSPAQPPSLQSLQLSPGTVTPSAPPSALLSPPAPDLCQAAGASGSQDHQLGDPKGMSDVSTDWAECDHVPGEHNEYMQMASLL